MAAGEYDIQIHTGEWLELRLVWKAGDPAVPVDLTGYSGMVEIGACGQQLLTRAASVSASGDVQVLLPHDDLLAAGIVVGAAYKYRLVMTDPTGRPRVLLTGLVRVVC